MLLKTVHLCPIECRASTQQIKIKTNNLVSNDNKNLQNGGFHVAWKSVADDTNERTY